MLIYCSGGRGGWTRPQRFKDESPACAYLLDLLHSHADCPPLAS